MNALINGPRGGGKEVLTSRWCAAAPWTSTADVGAACTAASFSCAILLLLDGIQESIWYTQVLDL